MPKGILYVESRPNSPEEAEAYHRWYEEQHMPEMVALPGIVSARRLAPLAEDGPFIAIYELEADDLASVQAALAQAGREGRLSRPVGAQTGGSSTTVRFYREIASYAP